jgi:hypothetical protein
VSEAEANAQRGKGGGGKFGASSKSLKKRSGRCPMRKIGDAAKVVYDVVKSILPKLLPMR